MKELVQDRLFKKRTYIVEDQFLIMKMKDFNRMTESAVSYEHIHKVILDHRENKYDDLFLSFVLMGFGLSVLV